MKSKVKSFIIIAVLLLWLGSTAAQDPIEAVVVEEGQSFLFPITAPIIAKLAQPKTPILLALSSPIQPAELKMIEKVVENQILVIKASNALKEVELNKIHAKVIKVSTDVMDAAISLAKNYWSKSEEIVVASFEDKEAMIYGTTLATHKKIPFVPVYKKEGFFASITGAQKRKFNNFVQSLGVKKVINAVYHQSKAAQWLSGNVKKLKKGKLLRAIVESVGKENVQNVIVTHLEGSNFSTPIIPYLSLARNSSVFITKSSNGKKAEKEIYKYIKTNKITPRSVTIVANYSAISLIHVKDPDFLGEYDVEVEPCTSPLGNQLSSMAVGRIPFNSLRDTSVLLARGIARQKLIGKNWNRLLMVANPGGTEHEGLPLAETVSRATAEEFKNFRFTIDEFYRVSSSDQEVLDAADKANLIIFEGHVTDQYIFESSRHEGESSSWSWSGREHKPTRNLTGQAMVILQSCSSLEEVVGRSIFQSGGVGLIGSVTSIHSASGSTFIKTYCDSLLYRNATIGEALRDSRNYFYCLSKLRKSRGHKELAKLHRVALSFRLWGDPEVQLFPKITKKPKRRPLKAKFVGTKKIRIVAPGRSLPKSKTEKYYVRMLPRSKLAGLVKRLKKKAERRLMLLYFFKLPIPEGFNYGFDGLKNDIDTTHRATFMVDTYKKNLYMLYFPKKDRKREKIILKFRK